MLFMNVKIEEIAKNMDQSDFNELYNVGLEADRFSLTDSNIESDNLFESAIMKMFKDGLSKEEIKKAINESIEAIDEYIENGTI